MNSLKRLLFIITQSEMGGAQRFLYDLVTHLDKTKYEISVAVGRDGDGELVKLLKEKNINVIHLHSLRRNIQPIQDIKALFEIKKLIKKSRPDTLFLLSSKAGFISSLASHLVVPNSKFQILNSKVIYRIGGWTFNDPWPMWKKKMWIVLEKISALWKDTIIVNSSKDLEQAKELGIRPKENMLMIHNGIDPYKIELLDREEARSELSDLVRQKAGIGLNNKTIIGTIANLYPAKDIGTLIKTAEYIKKDNNIVFIVIGDGSQRKKLESQIADAGIKDRFILVGHLENARRLLPGFDIFVLSSSKEGFPWALIEAMAARLPVIATRVGAVPEIIENGQNGYLVDPGNPEQIADKTKLIIKDDKLRQELGIQAHQTVLFKFDLSKMLKQIENLL